MQIFNLGIGEVVFILLIAVVVLGPERILLCSRKAGRWIRVMISNPLWGEIVATSKELRQIPDQLMEETGLGAEIRDLNTDLDGINHTISGEWAETCEDAAHLPVSVEANNAG